LLIKRTDSFDALKKIKSHFFRRHVRRKKYLDRAGCRPQGGMQSRCYPVEKLVFRQSGLKAFCLFHRLLRAEGVDKLLGCPGAAAAAADGEGFRQLVQLFRRDGEAVLEGKVVDNLKVDLLARLLEGDGETEPVGEGGELLDGVADMQVGALPVGEVLLDQVAAVGGGVDREVGRPGRDAPLEDGF